MILAGIEGINLNIVHLKFGETKIAEVEKPADDRRLFS